MKHFINTQLLAPNALTVAVDYDIVSEFSDLARKDAPGSDYYTHVPWPEFSDMRWISGASVAGFERFEDAYHRLGIAHHVREYLDLDEEVRYYTGFLHTRRRCATTNLHVDWKANNEGFTLITPIFGPESRLKLVYQTMTGEIAEYRYQPGEAIIFGDYFTHSSPAGESEEPASFLVFNFGSDRMTHWDRLAHMQQWQSPLVQRPDGKFIKVDPSRGLGDPNLAIERRALDLGA